MEPCQTNECFFCSKDFFCLNPSFDNDPERCYSYQKYQPDYKNLYEESEKLNFKLSANQCVANGLRVDEDHDSVFCIYKEKQESACEMFQRLIEEIGFIRFSIKLGQKMKFFTLVDRAGNERCSSLLEKCAYFLVNKKPHEAIKIMQEIEKELSK